MASEGICRHRESPQRMPRTEHSGNLEFGPLTPPLVGKGEEEVKTYCFYNKVMLDCELHLLLHF